MEKGRVKGSMKGAREGLGSKRDTAGTRPGMGTARASDAAGLDD